MTKQRTVKQTLTAVLVSAGITLGGCSGGGATLPHAVQSIPAATKTAKATFTIHWPQHAIAAAHTTGSRTPKFISPSALSVIVEVNPNAATAGPVTFANASGSSTSSVTIDAPVGTDEFVFTLWDTKQNPNETAPVGNILGQADVPSQKIVAGKTNIVNATIGGITNTIAMAPLPNQPFAQADGSTGYDLVGDSTAIFAATAYDAGGNVIVAPGAPSLSFAASGSSTGYIDVESVSGKANEFTVRALAAANSTLPFAVTATATDAGVPHTATSSVSFYVRSALYVSYGTGSGSRIAVYDDRGNVIPLAAGAFPGLTSPAGVAYSPSAHRVFVADSGSNNVLAFDAAGNPVSGFTPPSLPGARGIEYDAQSGTLYATGSSTTIAFDTNGNLKSFGAGAFSQTTAPDGISYFGKDRSSNPIDGVAIANDATHSIDYYNAQTGAYIWTDTLASPAAAPITGLAWHLPAQGNQLLVVDGGSAGAGFGITTSPGWGFVVDHQTNTTTRYAGVTFVSTIVNPSIQSQYEAFVVQSDANQIQGYMRDPYSAHLFTKPDILIATPSTSGLSNPIGIAAAL